MKNSQLNRPFLKWAGGKFSVLPHILPRLPKARRLIEPFVGAGAVFLNTEYDHYLLADVNPDLINVYTQLKDQGEDFIRYCRRFFAPRNNVPEAFYYLRERFNRERDARAKAALFIYLNRHGYNGLCRYNRSGGFNVPFGRYKKVYFPEQEMRTYLLKAPRVELLCADFSVAFDSVKKGEVVYCDPPYVPLSKTASFVAYAKAGFDVNAQQRLVEHAEQVRAKGATVLISNHDTESVRELYCESQMHYFSVRRLISRNGAQRNLASEVLAVFD